MYMFYFHMYVKQFCTLLYHSGKLGIRNRRKRCWNKTDPFLSFTSRYKVSNLCTGLIAVVVMWSSLTLFHLLTCKGEYSRKTAPLSYLVGGLEGMLNMQGTKIWVSLKWVDVTSVFRDLGSTLFLKLDSHSLFIRLPFSIPAYAFKSQLWKGEICWVSHFNWGGSVFYLSLECFLYSTHEC